MTGQVKVGKDHDAITAKINLTLELQSMVNYMIEYNSVIVTGADWGDRIELINWMIYMKKLNINRYIVLCYDTKLFAMLGSWKTDGNGFLVDMHKQKTRNDEVYVKHIIIMEFIKKNVTAIWTDLDCIWLNDFRQKYIHPYRDDIDILSQFVPGFELINPSINPFTGLFVVFPSNTSIQFYTKIIEGINKKPKMLLWATYFNEMIIKLNETTLPSVNYSEIKNTTTVIYPIRSSLSNRVVIGFLPYLQFPSGDAKEWDTLISYLEMHRPVVWHMHTAESGTGKFRAMRDAGVFYTCCSSAPDDIEVYYNTTMSKMTNLIEKKSIPVSKSTVVGKKQPRNHPCIVSNKNSESDFTISFIAAARNIAINNSVILTGANWNYRGTLINWLLHMQAINVTNYIVLCYDDLIFNAIGSWSKGGHGVYVNGCQTPTDVMLMKHVAVMELLMENMTATWSDADCIWLKDFRHDYVYAYRNSISILGQYGTYPSNLSKKHGATVCAGFFTAFPSAQSVAFYEELMVGISTSNDDQVMLNSLISRFNTSKFPIFATNSATHATLTHKNTSSVVFAEGGSPSENLIIGFLPYRQFPRGDVDEWAMLMKSPLNKPFTWHMLTSKSGPSKVDAMLKAGVFMMDKNWNQSEYWNDVMIRINPGSKAKLTTATTSQFTLNSTRRLQLSNSIVSAAMSNLDFVDYLDAYTVLLVIVVVIGFLSNSIHRIMKKF